MSDKGSTTAAPSGGLSFAKAVRGTARPAPAAGAADGGNKTAQAGKERFTYALTNLLGLPVELQVKSGSIYEGVFHTTNISQPGEFGVVLKMAKLVKDASLQEGQVKMAEKPQKVMTFSSQDIVQLVAKNFRWLDHLSKVSVDKSNGEDGFQTDAAIGAGRGGKDRELHRWVPEDEGVALEGEGLSRESTGAWDQFAENKRLFGVSSSFDENVYTTRLQKPMTAEDRRREREAERIAREIESERSSNPHLVEERGQAVDAMGEEVDEEDKYSAVLTTTSYSSDTKAPSGDKVAEKPEKADAPGKSLNPVPPAGPPPPSSGAPASTSTGLKSSLNPNAKEFKLSASAAAFVPRKPASPSVSAVATSPSFAMMPGAPPMPAPGMIAAPLPVAGAHMRPSMPYTVMSPGTQQQFVANPYGAMRSPTGYMPQSPAYGITYQPQMYAPPVFVPQQQGGKKAYGQQKMAMPPAGASIYMAQNAPVPAPPTGPIPPPGQGPPPTEDA